MNLKTPPSLLPFLLTFLASGWCYTWGQTVPAELTAIEIGVRSLVCEDDGKLLLAVWASNDPKKIDIYRTRDRKFYGSLELPGKEGEAIVGIRFPTKQGEGIFALSNTGTWMRWLVASDQPVEVRQMAGAKGLRSLSRFSADNSWVVCATFNGWAVWDLNSGEKIAESDEADGPTQELAILKSGNAFLSVGTKGATWFDIKQNKIAKRVSGIEIDAGSCKTSPGKKFIAGLTKGKVHIFEVDALLADFADFKPETEKPEFSFAKDNYLLVANFEQYRNPIDAWNLTGGLKDFRFANPITDRTNGSFTGFPESDRVVFVGENDNGYPKTEGIMVKPIDNKKPYAFGRGSIQSRQSSDVKYSFLSVSSKEDYLIVGHGDREVQVWSLDEYVDHFTNDNWARTFKVRPSGTMLGLFELPRSIESARWYGGDEFVVLKLVDGNEFLVSLRKGFDRFESKLVRSRNGDDFGGSAEFQDIEYSPDGKLICCRDSHELFVLDAISGDEVFARIKSNIGGWFNQASNRLLTADSEGWYVVDLNSKATSTVRNLPQGKYRSSSQLASKIFIEKRLAVIDPDQPAVIRTFDREPGDCGPIEISADGRRVAVAGRNSDGTTLEVFDVESGESYSKINIEKDGAYDLAFVGDGSQVAVCGGNKIRIYDFKRRRLLKEFPKESTEPKRIEFDDTTGTQVMIRAAMSLGSSGLFYRWNSPLGAMDYHPATNRIAVCRNNFVEIWDVEKESILFKTGLESEGGTAIAFSPDGTQVTVGQKNHFIQILTLPVK